MNEPPSAAYEEQGGAGDPPPATVGEYFDRRTIARLQRERDALLRVAQELRAVGAIRGTLGINHGIDLQMQLEAAIALCEGAKEKGAL